MNWGSREECQCPSTVWEGTKFWSRVYTKKYSIRCQISRSKIRYSVSTKIAFQPSQGLIQINWGSREECNCRVQSDRERFSDLVCIRKSARYVVKFRAQKVCYSVSTKIAFQPSQGFIQINWGSREECNCRVQSDRERFSDLGCIRKSTRYVVKFRAQ